MVEQRQGLRTGLSPYQAVRLWQASGPNITQGIIEVVYWTPNRARAAGHEAAIRIYYLREGVLAIARVVHRPEFGQMRQNGLCWTCGRVYEKPVIACYAAPDPDGGQFLPLDEKPLMKKAWVPVLRARLAYTLACPDCAVEHGLLDETVLIHPILDRETGIRIQPRAHPTLAKFRHAAPIRVRLDLCEWQRGVSDEIAISIAAFGVIVRQDRVGLDHPWPAEVVEHA